MMTEISTDCPKLNHHSAMQNGNPRSCGSFWGRVIADPFSDLRRELWHGSP